MEISPPASSRVLGVSFSLILALSGHAGAQSNDLQRTIERSLIHIYGTEPRRPTGAARRDNITDEEVREVQSAARSVYPGAIVNISTVTDGCGCEESESCTAQVWLVTYRPDRTRGLMLSRINGHWEVGVVQDWWLRYYELQERRPPSTDSNRRTKFFAWQLELQDLVNAFPVCESRLPAAAK